ncbi:hypothetical protein JZO73_10680 [Enterococcus plantarum]|nr:hypothetical protein [Enterococcus plantarum]MBO0467995.1 hypothetical protein [Enterococcus plantarum]
MRSRRDHVSFKENLLSKGALFKTGAVLFLGTIAILGYKRLRKSDSN